MFSTEQENITQRNVIQQKQNADVGRHFLITKNQSSRLGFLAGGTRFVRTARRRNSESTLFCIVLERQTQPCTHGISCRRGLVACLNRPCLNKKPSLTTWFFGRGDAIREDARRRNSESTHFCTVLERQTQPRTQGNFCRRGLVACLNRPCLNKKPSLTTWFFGRALPTLFQHIKITPYGFIALLEKSA